MFLEKKSKTIYERMKNYLKKCIDVLWPILSNKRVGPYNRVGGRFSKKNNKRVGLNEVVYSELSSKRTAQPYSFWETFPTYTFFHLHKLKKNMS